MSDVVAEKLLPTWDLTTIYPAIDSPEYLEAVSLLTTGTSRLEALLDTAESGGQDPVTAFEAIQAEFDTTLFAAFRLMAYLSGHTSVDSRDQLAQARMSEVRIQVAQLSKVSTRFTAWIGSLDVEDLIASSQVAQTNAFVVRTAAIDAKHQMTAAEESLAADLGLSGGHAWTQLYDDVTSQIMVSFANADGETESLPMTEIRNLAMHADRDVRRRAWEAELDAWKQWETPIAAALNGIKGEHTNLAERRQWESPLDEALHQNHIDRITLDAMMGAARDAFPDFRRYFRAKAKALGIPALAWYDLFAPLSASEREWPWEEAMAFVCEQFGTYSGRLRDLAERSVHERWIDVAPRPGKVGGAFCMPAGVEESRVLLNFTPAFDGVSTLAHELGHAYHNLCQAETPIVQRMSTPMTLAETASTFCETILRKAAISSGTADEAFSILEGSLQDSAQVIVDITSRFLFEQAVMERRPSRALSSEEFSEIMLDAQRQTYGDGLDPDALHSYMWAAKGHYYSSTEAFYNYPYMFGLLFGLGLYATYLDDPDGFRARYDDLLASTGRADAATLAREFGFDVQSREFWEGSLNVIRADIDRFVEIVDQRFG